MRAGIVAIVFFAAALALGHYVAAPFFCRGGISIPTLDPRALCGADMHLSRSGSVLLYFGAIGIAFFFGLIAAMLPGGKSAPKEKAETKPAETFEEVVASSEKQPAPAATATAAAEPSDEKKSSEENKPALEDKKTETEATQAKPEAAASSTAPAKTEGTAASTVSEAIAAGLSAKKNGASKTFDGTNEELLARFRELKKQEGINSVAQAQRLLDESTLGALAKGIDPKQHLSEVAHLVLSEDPDLKSGVVRGVVVHIAARLKELGVAKQNIPSPEKGAA